MAVDVGFAAGAAFGKYNLRRHVKAAKRGVSLHKDASALPGDQYIQARSS